MVDDLPRCDSCGARRVNDPETESAEARLAALGYLAIDCYHDHDSGATYHGHALDSDRGGDGFGEVRQNHESDSAHERAREAFDSAPIVCPRHYRDLAFCKSVAPTGSPSSELFGQGKCPECECLGLVEVSRD